VTDREELSWQLFGSAARELAAGRASQRRLATGALPAQAGNVTFVPRRLVVPVISRLPVGVPRS